MAGYDDSEDIESLLRSAVRGDHANASDTEAGAPTPAADDDKTNDSRFAEDDRELDKGADIEESLI